MTTVNEVKIAQLALAGESVASYVCDTCGWVEEFELVTGLPTCCPACHDRSTFVVQFPAH